ncbi:hypothetical protein BT96DRAFT_979351 [Gymnopus androsaceus JB14]|uniref:Uncharacterized protein n=1 Tax=Gymnopus androsaceus JB14 TaxID=1447944 RepID=A0A6A4H344_9AGAR|nr:hypothetical protein BT96DRAFT_979351 [Gymnopus androsaceus JB14]
MAGGGEKWEHGPDDEGNGEDGSDRDKDEDVAQACFFTGDTDEDAEDQVIELLQCQGMSQSGSLASSSSKAFGKRSGGEKSGSCKENVDVDYWVMDPENDQSVYMAVVWPAWMLNWCKSDWGSGDKVEDWPELMEKATGR